VFWLKGVFIGVCSGEIADFCVGKKLGPIPEATTSKQAVEGGNGRGNIIFFF
jgi:hypothetical protein